MQKSNETLYLGWSGWSIRTSSSAFQKLAGLILWRLVSHIASLDNIILAGFLTIWVSHADHIFPVGLII